MSNVLAFHQTIPGYQKTPLVRLRSLSKELGVKDIFIKDESHRFGLKAYKVLGGSYGCLKAVESELRKLEKDPTRLIRTWDELLEEIDTLKSKHGRALEFCTATDGNHGYG